MLASLVKIYNRNRFGVSEVASDGKLCVVRAWWVAPDLADCNIDFEHNGKKFSAHFLTARSDLAKKLRAPIDNCREARIEMQEADVKVGSKLEICFNRGTKTVFTVKAKLEEVDAVSAAKIGDPVRADLAVRKASARDLLKQTERALVGSTAEIRISDLMAICVSLAEENERLRDKLHVSKQ